MKDKPTKKSKTPMNSKYNNNKKLYGGYYLNYFLIF